MNSILVISSSCEPIRRAMATARSSLYHSASIATRHAVRDASAPNSAGGVPDPSHPVVPAAGVPLSDGTHQLGTRPVASHCASSRIVYVPSYVAIQIAKARRRRTTLQW